ncbi:MAG: hypothetical protein IJZ04_03190 [Clostridia bacterium]|nr:hypothetical protein [Clostridia bacterium]
MKKLLALLLVLLLCFSCLLSCDENEESSSESSSVEAPSESKSSSSESSSIIEPSDTPKAPNETKTQVKQTEKYYRQISSGYVRTIVDYSGSQHNGNAFSDDIFDVNKASQFKIFSSHNELQAFSLLNHSEIESDLFEKNRIVAILRYYTDGSGSAISEVGFYNATFNGDNAKIELDLYHTGGDSTEDIVDCYELYFVVLPIAEIGEAGANGSIAINAERLTQYNSNAYKIDATVEKAEAYYVENRESKKKIEILDGLSWLPSYPFIAIHLENPLETDFAVNSFKYENGEIYLTVQIFGKKEMEMFDFPTNLITVSLQPIDLNTEISLPDNISSDCAINITLEYVS